MPSGLNYADKRRNANLHFANGISDHVRALRLINFNMTQKLHRFTNTEFYSDTYSEWTDTHRHTDTHKHTHTNNYHFLHKINLY